LCPLRGRMGARSPPRIRVGEAQNAAASRLPLARALVEDGMPYLQQNRFLEPPARSEQTVLRLTSWQRFAHRGLGIRTLTAALLLLSFTCVLSGAGSSDQIRSVAVSPDGKLLAVDFRKDNTSFIYKIAVETGVATRLTDAKDGEESSPAFSSDGKRIAYAYQPSDHRRSRIVIVNVDGSEPRQWSPSKVNDFSPVFRRMAKPLACGTLLSNTVEAKMNPPKR
jgi:hypothetical protein